MMRCIRFIKMRHGDKERDIEITNAFRATECGS